MLSIILSVIKRIIEILITIWAVLFVGGGIILSIIFAFTSGDTFDVFFAGFAITAAAAVVAMSRMED